MEVRPRSRWRACWLKGSCALLLIALVSACGTRPAPSQSSGGPLPRHTAVPSPQPLPSFVPNLKRDPWLAYLTDVNPGSAVEFATAKVGWRVDGQGAAPHLDKNLSAGPDATAFAWPGSSISRSSNGGSTWTAVYSPRGGIWGVDAVNASTAWAVGVTSLARTTDGGKNWQPEAEPVEHPLVSVDFVTPSIGFGLTTVGVLVETTDGGSHWASGSLGSPAAALCFASAQVGYVGTQDGDLYRTANGGKTWALADTDPFASRTINYLPVWTSLTCDRQAVMQSMQTIGSAALTPSQPLPYVVLYGSSNASALAVVATNNDAPDLTHSLPAADKAVADFGQVALSGATGYVVGLPGGNAWGIDVQRVGGTEGPYAPASAFVPPATSAALHPDGSAGTIVIHGFSLNAGQSWLLVTDGAVGTGSSFKSETMLLHSAGDGAWTTRNLGAKQSY
jgi:Photosynthesis system II assembly factor YCF48